MFAPEPAPERAALHRRAARVVLVSSEQLLRAADSFPAHQMRVEVEDVDGEKEMEPVGRSHVVFALIRSCRILEFLRVVEPKCATRKQLEEFHDSAFLNAMNFWQECSEETLISFNLVDDASPFPFVAQHGAWIAGASLTAAEELVSDRADVAINLCGGRHHAFRGQAAGFCYVNDVVLAAMRLQSQFKKILIVDTDVHHGDGTQAAFLYSRNVFTLSFHIFQPGFYPGTGSEKEMGIGTNRNVTFTINSSPKDYLKRFAEEFRSCVSEFKPKCIVFVCGQDQLKGDPRGGLKLTETDVWKCAEIVNVVRKEENAKLLLLGGGGYNFPSAARSWTRVVAEFASCHSNLPSEIPEHEFWELHRDSRWKFAN